MDRLIQIATNEAAKSVYMYKLGALVMDGSRIVGKGYNKLKTNPMLRVKYGYHSIHAEIDAIMKSNGKGDTLLVVRLRRLGDLSCSKPCDKCMKFAKDNGIKKIVYLDWNGDMQEVKV